MATVADLNTRVTSALAAIDASDWDTALRELLAAKTILATLPDGRQGPSEVKWSRADIDALIDDVRQKANAGIGVHRSRVVYARG